MLKPFLITAAFLLILYPVKGFVHTPGADTSFLINPSGSASFCQGGSVVLTVTSNMGLPGNIKFQWINNATGVITGATLQNYTVNAAGAYSVRIIRDGDADTLLQATTVNVLQNPTPDFTFSANNSCAGVPVTFTDKSSSTASIVNYTWDFGDPNSSGNNNSNNVNPTHNFVGTFGSNTQDFNVKLTVKDNNGCQNSISQIVTTIQAPDPSIEDNIDKTPFTNCGSSNFSLIIDNTSSTTNNTNYNIVWGDGSTPYSSATLPPTGTNHSYTTLGYFTIILTVTNKFGCVSSKNYTVYNGSNPQVPFSNPGSSTQQCVPFTYSIPSLPTNNPPGTTYIISTNDKTPDTVLNSPLPTNFAHTFTNSSCGATGGITTNTFMINIRAQNPCGYSDLTIQPITTSIKPMAEFSMNPSNMACVNSTVTLTNTSTQGTIVDNFGNCSHATKLNWMVSPATGWNVVSGSMGYAEPTNNKNTWGSDNLGLSFSMPGQYSISLIVRNDCGNDTILKQICIVNTPTSSFTIDNTAGCFPLTVNATNTSNTLTNCTPPIYLWSVSSYSPTNCGTVQLWSFTNNTNSSSINPSFIFTNPGTYTITLSVTYPCKTVTSNKIITVKQQPTVIFPTISGLCVPATINPSPTVTNCGSSALVYSWSFPGGNPTSSNSSTPGPIIYNTSGPYSLSLSVTNECGTTIATENINLSSIPSPPSGTGISRCGPGNATISATPGPGETIDWYDAPSGGTILYSGSSTYTTAIISSTTTYYAAARNITSGCVSATRTAVTATVNTVPPSPVAGSNSAICAGSTLNLTATAITGASYSWSGPNTFTSSLQNPGILNATTTASGVYSVTATVNGCSSTAGLTTIQVNAIPATPTAGSNNAICAGSALNLTATSITGATYSWSGPNSFTSTLQNPGILNATTAFTGTYSVTATVNGCSSTAGSTTVSVHPLPTFSITSPAAVCAPATIDLTDASVTAGSPAGLSYSYWRNAAGTSVLSAPNAVTSSGTYYIKGVDVNNCPAVQPVTVTVNPQPVAYTVTGGGAYCAGGAGVAVGLDNSQNGVNYQLFNGANTTGTPIPGTGSAISFGDQTAPGTYSVAATNTSTGCTQLMAGTVTVAVSPLVTPTVSITASATSICKGTSVTFTASPDNGGVAPFYQWKKNGANTGTNSSTYTDNDLTDGDIITCVLTSNACTTNATATSNNLIMVVNPIPAVPSVSNISYCQSAAAVALTATPLTGYGLQWYTTATGGTGSATAPVPSTATPGSKLYYVSQVTPSACEGPRAALTVIINPTPSVPGVTDMTYCLHAAASPLSASTTTGYTVNWYNTDATGGVATTAAPVPSTAIAGTTVYYVSQTSMSSCEGPRAAINVTVNAIPDVNPVANQPFCNGANTGNLSFGGSLPATSYSWTNDNTSIGLPATGSGTINFTATNTTALPVSSSIQVTPVRYGCTGTPVNFTITVNPSPSLSSTLTPAAICTNTPFNYTSTSNTMAVAYSWSRASITGIDNPPAASTGNTGTISETLINTTARPVQVTYHYVLTATGCSNFQNVNVMVNPDAKAQFASTLNSFCAPGKVDNTILTATSYPNANGSYRWYANDNLIGNQLLFPGYTISNPNDSVTIKLLVTSSFGCKSDSTMAKFYTVTKPVPSFSKLTGKGCGPLTVTFTNTTTPLPNSQFSYRWSFGNGSFSTDANPSAVVYQPRADHKDTTYYITLTALTQCDNITTLKDSVIVRATPVALFQPDTTVGCSINTSPFSFTAQNISLGKPNTYYWDFGDDNKDTLSSELPVSHVFTVSQISRFTIRLKATNECGSNEDSVKIIVYPRNINAKLFVDGPDTWGCAPGMVTFNNVSSGATKYVINFGDGSPVYVSALSVEKIRHFYQNAGGYTVTMVASNGCTNADTTLSLSIYLFQKPTADFFTPKNKYCKKEQVVFQNRSNTGLSYQWFFGDGSGSADFSPSHVYTLAGDYTVTLVVQSINSPGTICSDTTRHTLTIAETPVSTITANSSVKNCAPYYFTGTTVQPSGTIANWHFEDSFSADTTMSGNTGTHVFKTPGDYTVMLVVFNADDCSDTAYTSLQVIATPKAAFTASDSVKCYSGGLISFTNTSAYTERDVVTYSWYLDGVLQSGSTHFQYRFSAPASITSPVYHTVMLIATNSFGCSDTVAKRVILMPKAQPGFTVDPADRCVPLTITFNNTSRYATVFKWYLNGRLFSADSLPAAITLTQPATLYNIRLVADSSPSCGSDSVTLPVITNAKPVGTFTSFNNTLPCTGITDVQFTDKSTVPNGSIKAWYWNFGDGQYSNLQHPEHAYTIPGTYIVSHSVTDNNSCASDTALQLIKNFGKPDIGFVLNSSCIGTPSTPLFTRFDVGYGSTRIIKYLWDFGDGSTDTSSLPVHTYQKEGIYTVTLTAFSDSSCVSDTSRQTIQVYGKPIADFNWDISCISLPIHFMDKSIPGYGQSAIGSYRWNFGDGSALSSAANPVHTFKSMGAFTITLATSSLMCPSLSDTLSKKIIIVSPRDPKVYPVINASRGLPVQLAALQGGFSYVWNPVTGLNDPSIQNPVATYTVSDPLKIYYTIHITDTSGCTVDDRQEVWLFAEPDIFTPTAFTPNGDGANDLLLPVYVDITRIQYFRIFDRWGKMIFETSDMGKGWDGTVNGKPMPMDTYVYVITGIDKKGKTLLRKGNVTLIRD